MGARTGGSQGIKWRTMLFQDRNVHVSLRYARFHHRNQSPGEVQSSQLSRQHGDPCHLLSLSEKARLLLIDCSEKDTVKHFV